MLPPFESPRSACGTTTTNVEEIGGDRGYLVAEQSQRNITTDLVPASLPSWLPHW